MVLIGDMGSNHLGSLSRAKEMAQAFAEAGGMIFKGQLFKPEQYPHNIAMPEDWVPELREFCLKQGIGFLVSVFYPSFQYSFGAVKIAYSQRHNFPLLQYFWNKGARLIVSGDNQTWWPKDCVKLACVPRYPSNEKDYDFYSSDEFDGISCHCEGAKNILKHKPKWIEKHFKMGDSREKELSPDAGEFALTPLAMKAMIEEIKGGE